MLTSAWCKDLYNVLHNNKKNKLLMCTLYIDVFLCLQLNIVVILNMILDMFVAESRVLIITLKLI